MARGVASICGGLLVLGVLVANSTIGRAFEPGFGALPDLDPLGWVADLAAQPTPGPTPTARPWAGGLGRPPLNPAYRRDGYTGKRCTPPFDNERAAWRAYERLIWQAIDEAYPTGGPDQYRVRQRIGDALLVSGGACRGPYYDVRTIEEARAAVRWAAARQ
jgi:hypothetical protein